MDGWKVCPSRSYFRVIPVFRKDKVVVVVVVEEMVR
jgi:hypothetical protein